MKIFYFIFCILFLIAYSCLPDTELSQEVQNGEKPSVSTVDVSNIGLTIATLNGYVETGNGYKIIHKGFVIDTLNIPEVTGRDIEIQVEGNGKGDFSHIESDLSINKIYYVKAYATNRLGRTYGELVSFRTESGLPILSTDPIEYEYLIDGTAVCSGKLLFQGNAPIQKLGICYALHENPTVENDSVATLREELDKSEFSVKLFNIKGSQTYYYRTFSINEYGTAYGETHSFDTPLIWEKMKDFSGPARDLAATFTLNNNYYVVTGQTNTLSLNDNQVYIPEFNQWDTWNHFSGANRKGAVGFTLGNYGFVGFGHPDNTGGGFINDLYRYDPIANQWNEVRQDSNATMRSVVYAAAFSLKNKGYLVGGYTGRTISIIEDRANETYQCYYLNDTLLTWKRVRSFPIKTWMHIAFTYGDRAFVGLGIDGNAPKDPGTSSRPKSRYIYEYFEDKDSWGEDPENPEPFATLPDDFIFGEYGTQVAAAATNNGKAYFIGKKQIWELDLATRKWLKKSEMPGIHYGNIMFSGGKTIYIGISRNTIEFYKYNPVWDN